MRPDFTTSIPGTYVFRDTDNHSLSMTDPGRRFHSETTAGDTSKKQKGWKPPKDYFFSMTDTEKAFGSITETSHFNDGKVKNTKYHSGALDPSKTQGSYFPGTYNGFNRVYQLPSFPSHLLDTALIRARMAMKRTDVNVGVAFAERALTARLVGDTAASIARSIRFLRRGQFIRAANAVGLSKDAVHAKSVSANILAVQYGWSPLLQDIDGACSALAKLESRDWRITGKGAAKEIIRSSYRDESGEFFAGDASGLFGVFVRIDAIPEQGILQSYSALGLTNPALIAWELVPFSFVVDWMLPVGSWLESLDAMLGYNEPFCSISMLKKCEWKLKGLSGRTSSRSSRTDVQSSWSASRKIVTLSRDASKSVPLPSRPRLKDPRSMAHMLNGLSLLTQAVSGWSRGKLRV